MSKSAENHRRQNIGRHNAPCPVHPGKIRYRDDQQAKRALSTMKTRARIELEKYGSTEFRQNRVYECTACRGWHTTSQPLSGDNYVAVKTEAQSLQQMFEIAFADEIKAAQKS